MKYTSVMLLVMLFLSNGCIVDKYTTTQAYLHNNTTHSIQILFYKSGIVMAQDTVLLESNNTFQLANSTTPGNVTQPGFGSTYSGTPSDSIVVIFDYEYAITHYADAPASLADHYYLNSSTRNLGNPLSYEFTRKKGKKGSYTNIHNYYFTEQDYLDAKD